MAARRGQFKILRMTRIPMGASFAPAVAQRAARAVVAETLRRVSDPTAVRFDVWLDNFFGFAVTTAAGEELREKFLEVCAEAAVVIKEVGPVSTKICLLGLTIDFDRHEIGPAEALKDTLKQTMAAVDALADTEPTSSRAFLTWAGAVFYPNHVYGKQPLAMFDELFATIQHACKVGAEKGWDTMIDGRKITKQAKQQLIDMAHNLCEPTKMRPTPPIHEIFCGRTHRRRQSRQCGKRKTRTSGGHHGNATQPHTQCSWRNWRPWSSATGNYSRNKSHGRR